MCAQSDYKERKTNENYIIKKYCRQCDSNPHPVRPSTDAIHTARCDFPWRKYFLEVYPAEPQLNKANTSDKEISFLDLNIKVIGRDIHTSVYDKRDDFGSPIVNSPLLIGDVPRLPSYGIYISQLVRFARCCTSVLDFHSKTFQITSKLLTQGYRYHKLRKTFGKFFRSYSELLSKFGDISFQEYVFKGISHPVFYVDLVYKLRRVKDKPNFISSGSKIVKRLQRRQYNSLIIERTICLVLGHCTSLYRPFLKHWTLTNKAIGTIWRALSKPPQRRQGPDFSSPLIGSRDSFSHQTWANFQPGGA